MFVSVKRRWSVACGGNIYIVCVCVTCCFFFFLQSELMFNIYFRSVLCTFQQFTTISRCLVTHRRAGLDKISLLSPYKYKEALWGKVG